MLFRSFKDVYGSCGSSWTICDLLNESLESIIKNLTERNVPYKLNYINDNIVITQILWNELIHDSL